MNNIPLFVRTDEAQDVAGSIRHVLRCWDYTVEDPHAWKWVILALHSALQGACVCHLLKTAQPLGAVTKSNEKEWITYFNEGQTNPSIIRPKTKLMALPDLLKKVRKPNSAGRMPSAAKISISDRELQYLTKIHKEFRNQFTHFQPTGWSIEISGMPKLASLISRIISDILDCGCGFIHMNEVDRNSMKVNLIHLNEMTLPIQSTAQSWPNQP